MFFLYFSLFLFKTIFVAYAESLYFIMLHYLQSAAVLLL